MPNISWMYSRKVPENLKSLPVAVASSSCWMFSKKIPPKSKISARSMDFFTLERSRTMPLSGVSVNKDAQYVIKK